MMSSLRALRLFSLPVALACCLGALPAPGQTVAPEHNASSDRATAYYNYSMGHLYAEMAQEYNRQDYANKAIEFFRLALKQDPSITFINEELTDLYIQSGQLNKAVTEAENLLKENPNDLGARRILGRVYTHMIGDPQAGKVDEKMVKLAIEQYAKIVEQDPNDSESQLLLARLDVLSRNSAGAEKIYKAVLAKDADNEEAQAGLVQIYAERGDAKNAIEMLKRSGDENANPRTLAMLGQLYEQTKDYASAADAWQRAVQLAPDQERFKRSLAEDLLFTNKIEEARKIYEEIAAANKKDWAVQLRLSEIYMQQGDLAKARTAFEAAKKEDPENLEVKYDEVSLLDAESRTDDAIKALKGILDGTAKPEYSTAERTQRSKLEERLGMLYRQAGKYPLAVSTFHDIGTEDPAAAPRSSVEVVETYRQAKDTPAARRESDAALKKWPKERIVVMEHANVLADAGKYDQAVSEVLALKDGKNDRDMLLVAAQFDEKGKRFAEEQKLLDDAQKLSKTNAEQVGVRFMRGAMLEKMKDFDGAEAAFRAIIKDDPDNAGALNYLGYMLADRDQKLDEAQDLISKALKLDPQNYAYLDSLGWVYFKQNRLEAAEDQLRRALDKMGTDPTVHDHLGDVLLKRGKVKEAIAQWQTSIQNWNTPANADADPSDVVKVQRKLEDARVRIAQQTHGQDAH